MITSIKSKAQHGCDFVQFDIVNVLRVETFINTVSSICSMIIESNHPSNHHSKNKNKNKLIRINFQNIVSHNQQFKKKRTAFLMYR